MNTDIKELFLFVLVSVFISEIGGFNLKSFQKNKKLDDSSTEHEEIEQSKQAPCLRVRKLRLPSLQWLSFGSGSAGLGLSKFLG